jgi:RNA polymerase sigma-70 factor (ECF subfamily)
VSIYLIYTEAHTASAGPALARVELSTEAIRIGRVLATLMPDEPEVSGLLALMLLSEARRSGRLDPGGSMVRLADQDRSRWDSELIEEGHALVRACLRGNEPGPFQIQAAIAAVHTDASTADDSDWAQILALYDQLYAIQPNPVVALNRAVAVDALAGPAAGLAALSGIGLDDYQPYHATRADLLTRARAEQHPIGLRDVLLSPGCRVTLRRRSRSAGAPTCGRQAHPPHSGWPVARGTCCRGFRTRCGVGCRARLQRR